MKDTAIIIISILSVMNSYSQKDDNLTREDYLVLNVFLDQNPNTYLDLSLKRKSNSDSVSFITAYKKKLKLYNSLKNSCLEKLNEDKILDFETNFTCSVAETFKVYENLFSKDELMFFSSELNKKGEINYKIEYDSILVSDVKPLEKRTREDDSIIKIDGIYYNNERNKILIKYSINRRTLFHVLRKENGWWKNIINFDL